MGIPNSPPAPPAPDAVPRRHILRAMARADLAGRTTALSVSRLDAMRWHIRLSPPESGRRREIYLSPEDGGVLFATMADERLDIRLDGPLAEDCLRNLGDCLVRALYDQVRHIGLWLGRAEAASPGACGLFESLGRELARQRPRPRVDIHGLGQGAATLARALRRGMARVAPARNVA